MRFPINMDKRHGVAVCDDKLFLVKYRWVGLALTGVGLLISGVCEVIERTHSCWIFTAKNGTSCTQEIANDIADTVILWEKTAVEIDTFMKRQNNPPTES